MQMVKSRLAIKLANGTAKPPIYKELELARQKSRGGHMKVKMKKVYYCEYCGKHSLRPLEDHELHCTLNPHRECRLCGTHDIYPIIQKYKFDFDTLKKDGEYGCDGSKEMDKVMTEMMKELRNDVENCPVCILTVLSCNKWPAYGKLLFDFKKDRREYWEEQNEDEGYLSGGG